MQKKGYARAKRQCFEKLEDNEWIIKKGKGCSSFYLITEEGKNTYHMFINIATAFRYP